MPNYDYLDNARIPPDAVPNLRKAIEDAAAQLEKFEALLERRRKGEIISPHDLSEPLFAIQHASISDINMGAFNLSIKFTQESIDRQQLADYREWLDNDRVFAPKTAMEKDLWDSFHEFKEQGYSVLVFYSDRYKLEHPIAAIGKGVDRVEALEELKGLGMITIMAALDLHKTFQEQWPYIPGATYAPLQLTENPVITLPELSGSKPHKRAPYLRAVPD